jgi:hypothetical protein
MMNRRAVLCAGAGLAALVVAPLAGRAAATGANEPVAAALAESDTVYLSPLRSDGTESRCQAEVWFVLDGPDVCVVTATAAWRARAVRQGLRQARMWVGELGIWTRTDGRYRNLPQADVVGEFIEAQAEHERVLALFGSKYPLSWVLWGPRFRNGLEDGSRVMLRYRPAAV